MTKTSHMKTVYISLEDDVAKIVKKIKEERSNELVLVFPRQSFLFSDSINLRLLKKQLDVLGKTASILTMDPKGQMFAEEAGFAIKHMPKTVRSSSVADIRPRKPRQSAKKTASPALDDFKTKQVEEPTPPIVVESSAPRVAVSHQMPTAVTNIRTVTEEEQLEDLESIENVFLPPDNTRLELPQRRSYRKWVFGFFALSLIAVVAIVFVVLPSATIAVYSKPQPLSRDLDVTAEVNLTAPDSSRVAVPAVSVNETQTLSDTFQANGKKEVGSKAEGRVAIYNFTGNSINLRAGTTTLTVGDKKYYFKQDESGLRALSSPNDEANASVADIVAAEGGEGFNLPAGTRVEINNQVFGSQPQRLYAKTISQVVGGSSRFISVISAEDVNKSRDDLTKRMVAGINEKLKSKNIGLVEGAYTVNVVSFNTDKPEGSETPNFTADLQVTISGLAFDENALKEMIRQRMLMSMGKNRELQDLNSDKIVYKIKNLDQTAGLMQLGIHYESNATPSIDKDALVRQVVGKTKLEASELILANSDVDSVEIGLQPFWQRSLPRFTGKIQVEVKK